MRQALRGLVWRAIVIAALWSAATQAQAHEKLANGEPVPGWVAESCCGVADFHHLQPEQVHETSTGWRVDGYPTIIPYGKELPTQDGEIYIFYRTNGSGLDASYSPIYCFFIDPRSF